MSLIASQQLKKSTKLDQLSSGKAPGRDGIPAEVIKCANGTLLKELHEILCQSWREGEVLRT